jgi:hypothetical protein
MITIIEEFLKKAYTLNALPRSVTNAVGGISTVQILELMLSDFSPSSILASSGLSSYSG